RAENPAPAVKAPPSPNTRTRITSTSMYRAKPAQTPPIFLLRLSSINGRALLSILPAPVRLPQREQNRSSARSSTPHCVQYMRMPPAQCTQTPRRCSASQVRLILGRHFFQAIDPQQIHRSLLLFQLQSQLFLQRGEDRGTGGI